MPDKTEEQAKPAEAKEEQKEPEEPQPIETVLFLVSYVQDYVPGVMEQTANTYIIPDESFELDLDSNF